MIASNHLPAQTHVRFPVLAGVWRLADPKITLASVASMLLGASAAAHDGSLSRGWLAVTVVGVFALEAAKNASGEIFDWDSGADAGVQQDERSPFSGGKRVLVNGLLTRSQTAWVAVAFYLAAVAVGLGVVFGREPRVLGLCLGGLALAYFYHAPPLRLSYRGLGELAVALAYGPMLAAGTYLVQRHSVSTGVLWAAAPLGLAIAAYLGVALLPLAGLPPSLTLGLIGLPYGLAAARRVARCPELTRELIPAQAWTLISFLLMALGMSLGWLWAAP